MRPALRSALYAALALAAVAGCIAAGLVLVGFADESSEPVGKLRPVLVTATTPLPPPAVTAPGATTGDDEREHEPEHADDDD